MRVGLLLFPDVDLLDVGGPYEVFLTADRLLVRDGGPSTIELRTLSLDGARVTAYGGLELVPSGRLSDAGRMDVFVVPGAVAIDRVREDQRLIEAITATASSSDIVASVCTGAFLLAEAGLLEGRPWTTHWEDVDVLAEHTGSERGVHGVPWVDAGRIVTGGGLSSGIAMALHLVDRLLGRDLAERTARQIDYAWSPDASAG